MISYSVDKEIPDYLTLSRKDLLTFFETAYMFPNSYPNENNSLEFMKREIIEMIRKMLLFEEMFGKSRLEEINYEFKIKKDSHLGQYLLKNAKCNENTNVYISFQNIKEALLIAMYEDNAKVANKILPLFQNHYYGKKEDLLKRFPRDEEILDYIAKNNDFSSYVIKEKQDNSFIVYEEGNWIVKSLEEEYVRVPKKAEI